MLSRLSQLQNRLAKAGVKRMTKWCGLVGVIMIAASIAAARAPTGGQDQRLDIPWEGIAAASQRRARDVTEQAYHDPITLYPSLEASPEIEKSALREFRKILRCCAEDAGQSRSLTLLRANE
jgi:hypothetical protein